MKRLLRPLAAATALTLVLSAWAAGAEAPPPSDQTRLHFRKTLFVHKATTGKVFSETRKIVKGDVLWNILAREYGIAPADIPALVESYREVNPGLDPNLLRIGQVVRVPFKLETEAGAPPAETATRGDAHIVRAGDTLWEVLTTEYDVPPEEMGKALATVKKANPDLRDLDRLWVGQAIAIPLKRRAPEAVAKAPAPAPAPTSASAPTPAPPIAPAVEAHRVSAPAEAKGPAPRATQAAAPLAEPGPPPQHDTVLALLASMGCRVERTGSLYLPLARGRTIRLDGADFPLLEGPNGKKIILDPKERLTDALRDAIVSVWGYAVVRGVPPDAERYLANLLPLLGFTEVAEGNRTLPAGDGLEFVIQSLYAVAPTTEAKARGAYHLIFPADAVADPDLAALARARGLSLHFLGALPAAPTPDTAPPARLVDADEVEGASALLDKLGIPYELSPLVSCDLGGGVRYDLRPPLTFEYGGIQYAVPPGAPPKAESMLLKAGFFTFAWSPDVSTLNRLADLLGLVGVEHHVTEVELPARGALRLKLGGLVAESEPLRAALAAPETPAAKRILLTRAHVGPEGAALLRREGYLPWVVE